MTTQTNTTTSANDAYQARRNDIARLLDVLEMELAKLDDRAQAQPTNWGPAGTAGQVRTMLLDTVETISGISRTQIEAFLAE